MSRRAPAYTPLCMRHLRYYLRTPSRSYFPDALAKKQYDAAKAAVGEHSAREIQWLTSVVVQPSYSNDLLDAYITDTLMKMGMDKEQRMAFYSLLNTVNRAIAVNMGYISPQI